MLSSSTQEDDSSGNGGGARQGWQPGPTHQISLVIIEMKMTMVIMRSRDLVGSAKIMAVIIVYHGQPHHPELLCSIATSPGTSAAWGWSSSNCE